MPCLPALLLKGREMPGSKQAGPSALAGISLLLWSNTPEQNTEQKFILSFPYKTLVLVSETRLQTNRSVRLSLWPAHNRGLFPEVTCPLLSRGFCLTVHYVRTACPHPAAPHKPGFQAAPKALCGLKCFVLGFFFFFFFCLSEQPR